MPAPTITAEDTARSFAAFMTSFTEDVVLGDDDPGPAIDRHYAPGFEQYSDGIRLDRGKLIEHIGPVRKNLREYRYEVHEALLCGARLAVRFTVHAVMRKDRTVRTRVHLFADLAPDGRISRIDQITRILPENRP